MKATTPHVEILYDTNDHVMARSGTCIGMSHDLAVWRFGFMPGSRASILYGAHTVGGFLWVLATRRTGKIKDQWTGYAINLPPKYRKVIEWEPTA